MAVFSFIFLFLLSIFINFIYRNILGYHYYNIFYQKTAVRIDNTKIIFQSLVLILVLFIINFLFSQELTDDKDIIKSYTISSSFGDSRGDHFHTGIDLSAAEGEEIYSIMDSELFFYNSKKFREIHYGLGNFVVVQSLDNNYRIIYSHLKENSVEYSKRIYKKNEKIALVGNSGHSTGPHLHLEVENIKENILLNPIKFIKLKDSLPPFIEDIYFITNNREQISLLKSNSIKKGGKLFIKAVDRINSQKNIITPYKIFVLIGGKENALLIFDYFKKLDNDYYIKENNYKFKDIYQNNTRFDYFLMDFSALPSVIGLNIIVEDYNGNKTEFRKAIKILPPDL